MRILPQEESRFIKNNNNNTHSQNGSLQSTRLVVIPATGWSKGVE